MKKRGYSARPASESDLSSVARIEELTIRPPWKEAQFQQELEKKHSHFWVVTDDETDEKLFGYVVFSFPAEQAHIQTIAVDPEFQRGGIASYLMRKIIQYVSNRNGESIILEVRAGNAPAVQFYQKIGFVILRTLRKFYPDGEDGFVMIYKLDQKKIGREGEDEESGESLGASEGIESEGSEGSSNSNGRKNLN